MMKRAIRFAGLGRKEGQLVTRCCGCKRFKNHEGTWVRLIAVPAKASITDGICVPCIKSRYPGEVAERVVAKLSAEGLA